MAALEGVDMVITTTKILAVSAAVMAAGLVAIVDLAQSRGGAAPADVVAARFPSQAEMLVVLPEAGDAAKADKDGGCVREHWPYIADE
ncbi:MAG: hypothetical protein IT538_05285, partial [Variibacter sp.]|nr:hypothetical protein [Variibacter sp.]